ncbi:hypothetical protein [Actinomyces vulturis]|nr:hypothetical protein [Actinomyces vulturis]
MNSPLVTDQYITTSKPWLLPYFSSVLTIARQGRRAATTKG